MNDIEQIHSGLYGGIVVLPFGETFDPSRDHVYIAGWDGEGKILVNGNNAPLPLTLAAGVPHRFRFIGIGAAGGARFSIRRDTTVLQWRSLARDGADLPPSRAGVQRAMEYVGAGETRDFEWTPEPGVYFLVADGFGKPVMTRRLIVQ
jgi:hypothetical protein